MSISSSPSPDLKERRKAFVSRTRRKKALFVIAQYGLDLSNAVSNAPLAPLRAQTIIVKVVYFWTRLSRDDFRSKLEILFSFQSYVHFEELFPRALVRFGMAPKVRALGFLVLAMPWSFFLFNLKTPLRHRDFFANFEYDREYFLKMSLIFSKQSRCHLPDSHGDLQAEQGTFVMVRRNLTCRRWWSRDRAQNSSKDLLSSWRSVLVDCGEPWSKREKAQWSQNWCDWAKYQPFIVLRSSEF